MFEFLIEYDINPVIIFNEKGHVLYCNQEAEIFLSYVNVKDIFNFTIQQAPLKEGIKTEFKNINFGEFSFNGYSIGYQEGSKIGIRLFINTKKHQFTLENLEKVDLNKLIDFAIQYINLKQKTKFKIYPDLSIEEVYISKKEFLQTLFEIFENQKKVEIYTKFNIAEVVKIKEKKYSLIEIILKCELFKEIESKYFEIIKKDDGYIIKVPFIKEKNENNNT